MVWETEKMSTSDQGNVERMVETYILETDPSTGLDIRYTAIRVPESEADNYPKILYHDLSGERK